MILNGIGYRYKALIAFFQFKNIIYTLIENTCNLQTENC